MTSANESDRGHRGTNAPAYDADFCRARAADELARANAAQLGQQRMIAMRAHARWLKLADQAERMEARLAERAAKSSEARTAAPVVRSPSVKAGCSTKGRARNSP